MTINIIDNISNFNLIRSNKIEPERAYICTDSVYQPNLVGSVFVGNHVTIPRLPQQVGQQIIHAFSICGRHVVYASTEATFEEINIDVTMSKK